MRKILIGLTVLLCLMAAEAGVSAAAYIKFDGVDGEATDKDHQGWIELTSVSHAIHKPGTGATGATRRRGDVVLEDISLSKEVDKASPKLAEAVCNGRMFPKVEIHVTTSYADAGRQTYYKYELKNVYVTSYSVSASGDDQIPVEDFSLNFEEIKVEYSDGDGKSKSKSKSKGNIEYNWKVEEGEK